MRKKEGAQSRGITQNILGLILGALLALGIELLLLLLGSVAVSAGVMRKDAAVQVSAASCLIGCFIGGCFTCRSWKSRLLPAGLLTGLCCFGLILLGSLFGGNTEFGTAALIELASCFVGGGLAGFTAGRKKPKKRRTR